MRTRVLIADDARFMREMERKLLEPAGFEIVGEAADGFEAAELYRARRPDLVLLDLLMPRCCGVEAVRAIRRADARARIVMCSAPGQEALLMEALEAGALDFVVKPLRPECLLSALARLQRP
jgi:two-component system chemotaxis response regulator CheY